MKNNDLDPYELRLVRRAAVRAYVKALKANDRPMIRRLRAIVDNLSDQVLISDWDC